MQRTTLFVIPGFGESMRDPAYRELARQARRAGLRVIGVDVHWDRTTFSDWVEESLRKAGSLDNAIILGFSFGAMVALEIARQNRVSKIIACSPSPFYQEDIPQIRANVQFLGVRRLREFAELRFPETLRSRVVFMMGESDWDYAILALKRRYRECRGRKKLVLIPGVGHDIGDRSYLAAIMREIIPPSPGGRKHSIE
jgi:hypothetical protein